MPRIQLIQGDPAVVKERAKKLREAGYTVVTGALDAKQLKAKPPQALLIDLARMPSQGRDIGLWMRTTKATRHVALVFVDGDPAKVEAVKKLLPDAVYTSWRGIRGALKRALAKPPKNPVKPASNLAGYSGTPLPKKLGIKPGSVVILASAPRDFEKTLGELPDGVVLRRQARGNADLAIWFTTSQRELDQRIVKMGGLADGLWIAWPKQASGVKTDLTGNEVRRTGLANGLVDYKVCAIDGTWSGLKFTRRK